MTMADGTISDRGRRPVLWRSRWAAIGAAVAVSLGAGGGFFVANAVPGPAESTIVSVTPERILDTRNGNDIGLPGPFVSAVSQKLQVTGNIPTATGTKTVVPAGATGVLLNVTPVSPSADGFVSIRPGDATGAPTTSSLNVVRGGISPNSVQVSLPSAGANAGQIDITFDAYGVAGPTTDLLVDVVGYTTNTGLQQLVADVAKVADGPVVKAFGVGTAPTVTPADFAPTLNLSTTVASRLFIQVHHAPVSPTGCIGTNRVLWIEIDGVRIESSAQVAALTPGETVSFTLSGVTEGVVPAGVHIVRPRQGCFSGTASTSGFVSRVPGIVTYVSDDGTAAALESGGDLSTVVTACEGTEVDGTCIAKP